MSLAIAPAVSATADVNLQVDPPFPGSFRNHSRIFLVSNGTQRKSSEGGSSSTTQEESLEEIDFFSYEAEQNITAQEEPLGEFIKALFREAKEIAFEDGMETKFSKELIRLVKKHGKSAMEVITTLIVNDNVDAEVAAEALRWLGRMDHPPTYRDRRWLLEHSLFCSSALIRDGAALGLASLDDPHAIPYLQQAIEQEKYASLREDLEQVLEQLESTRSAVSPEKHP